MYKTKIMKFNKILKYLLILALVFVANSLTIYAQGSFPYEEYEPRTLSEIVSLNADVKNADVIVGKKDVPHIVLNANFLHSQARVKFMNKTRPVSTDRKELLKIWQKTYGIEERIANLYENEYLFKECDYDYWIPVQKQVAAYFPKELKEGDMISLFIMRVGGKKINANWDWLFLANEFKKY